MGMTTSNFCGNGTPIVHTAEACKRKTRFEDEAAAWGMLLKIRRRDPEVGATLQTYECGFCKGWHLGNRPGASVVRRAGVVGRFLMIPRGRS